MSTKPTNNSRASSPEVTEALARTMEKDAAREPSKVDRDQKMRNAQVFREKMKERHRPN